MPIEGENDKGRDGQSEREDDEGRDDMGDQHASKRIRMSVDAEMALAGLKTGILDTGRISRSSSTSSISSVKSAMSTSL